MQTAHEPESATSTIQPALSAWPAVRESWARLHSVQALPTMFLSEAWVDCWLSVYGVTLRPDLWVLRRENEVIGAALLVRRTERRGPFRLRCIHLNTAGEGDDSVTTEHNTVLAKPGCQDVVWLELGRVLRTLEWDELRLEGGTEDATERLKQLFPEWRIQLRRLPSPFVPLHDVREQAGGFLALVSANTRAQLRRAARAVEATAPLVLDEARTPSSRSRAWAELMVLHTRRWSETGQPGVFSHARWRAFHEGLLTLYPDSTRLFRLRIGDETVAAAYLLQHGSHVAFYQSGVQHGASHEHTKHGLILHARIVEYLAGEDLDEYDYLASDEVAVRYKRSLASAERSMYWGAAIRPTWRSRAVGVVRLIRRWLRSKSVDTSARAAVDTTAAPSPPAQIN